MCAIIAWCFPIWYFLSVALSESMCIFAFGPSLSTSNFFPHVAYLFSFSVMFSSLPYFAPKLFCFFIIRLLVCLRAISLCLLVELFSLFWNVLFCLYCFILSQYLFSLPSFASSFWFISSSCFICFTCVAFFYSCPNIFQCFPLVFSFLLVVIDFLSAFPV